MKLCPNCGHPLSWGHRCGGERGTHLKSGSNPERNALPRLAAVSRDAYHADDLGDQPTLSASMINLLLAKSPAHARHAHPKLNPTWQPREDSKFDVGSAVHDVFLEGRKAVDVVDAPDWRRADAKAVRELIRAEGRIPLLTHQFAQVEEIVAAIREQLAARDDQPALFADGQAEQTIVWQENGVVARARLDYLNDARTLISDLKTTSASGKPESWSRTMYGFGADVQVAWYMRAVASLDPGRIVPPEFRFLVVEVEPPYAISVFGLAPSALEVANAKIDHALGIWKRCLERDEWPGYRSDVAFIEVPGWELARWDGMVAA